MHFDPQRRSLFTVPVQERLGRTLVAERSGGDPVASQPGLPGPPGPLDPVEMDATARRWQIGEVVNGRYRIIGIAGEGGMGRVYRVDDALHPERKVALKTLGPAFLESARVQLFKAEFHTLSALSHPNIASVFDFEAAGGGEYFFTMEHIEGQDLLAAAAAQASGAGERTGRIVDQAVEACRALQYLHSRGFIHADFKPQNVLVTPTGVVKVVDFGLSGGIGAGLRLGTPAYMAPELGCAPAADARVDLYALGITLFQLLCGRVPFGGGSAGEVFHQHAHAPLPFPADVPLDAGVRAVIERLCAKAPEDRFAGANEVIEALARATGKAYAPETAQTRTSYVSDARLVGRETEKNEILSYCLSRAEGRYAGEAALAAVSGASGVGKSRLMREVRKQLQLADVPFVEASCYEGSFGELAPLRQWSEALRSLCRAWGLASLEAEHRQTLAWLSEKGQVSVSQFPERAGNWMVAQETEKLRSVPSSSEEESLRMGRLRDLADFILKLSRAVAFTLYLDDLQWARSSAIDLLGLLCDGQAADGESGSRARLALVVSYRDEAVAGRPLQELLDAVRPERRVEIRLAPLLPGHTAELIGSMLGTSTVPEAFSARIASETGGNPFFIEEVMRALMERGDVYLESGGWAAKSDVAYLDVPPTIAAVLERRLSALPESERTLLDWLAVYAQPMPLGVLDAASGMGWDCLARDVERLSERHWVAHVSPACVRLAHDRLREYVYAKQDRGAGQGRHLTVARALDRLATIEGEYVFERAHHYWHAGAGREALPWCEAAAHLADRGFATDVAIDNYERVRALAGERGDEEKRRAATDRLLELCTVAGRYEQILSLTQTELSRRDEPIERARLRQLQGEALGGRGDLSSGLERLREATALLGGGVPRARWRRRLFIAWHYVKHLFTLRLGRDFALPQPLDATARRRREILARSYLLMSNYATLSGDDDGYGVSFAGFNAALPLGRHEILCKLIQNVAFGHHVLGHHRLSERLIREAQRMARTEIDRANLLTIELLARQSTQHPIFPEQRPVYAHEAEAIKAIETLSTRTKALYAHLARAVATTLVWQYAPRFQFRPEVFRWAEAMRGTVHHGFVEGGAAVMALIDGQTRRAAEAYARAQEGNTTPFYRAWIDANYAYACAVTGDTAQAMRCLEAVARTMAGMSTRAASSLWVPALSIAACVVLRTREPRAAWPRSHLQSQVARLHRARRRLPPNMRLIHEAGRLALGRGALAALSQARDRSRASWSREPSTYGHPDACLVAALALGASNVPEQSAAARAWAEDALSLIEPRFPAGYTKSVRMLLGL